MNDKPQMQFKLSLPDTDALRAMIRRDHAKVCSAITTKQAATAMASANKMDADVARLGHEAVDLQRRIIQIERLAQIFSVDL